jgi:DNA-binding CsgD family transcriptional regulator
MASMVERSGTTCKSGDALFAFDSDLAIVSWNHAAEDLTGISAGDAIGRHCWEVLRGHDERGNLVCHPGCSTARLAREDWPVSCQGLLIKTQEGKRHVDISTVAVDAPDRRLFLHVLRPRAARSPRPSEVLTKRQQDVLQLLVDGIPAKVIAKRLGVAEATVRNHIRAILVAVGAHSQLEAIAKARRLQLVE